MQAVEERPWFRYLFEWLLCREPDPFTDWRYENWVRSCQMSSGDGSMLANSAWRCFHISTVWPWTPFGSPSLRALVLFSIGWLSTQRHNWSSDQPSGRVSDDWSLHIIPLAVGTTHSQLQTIQSILLARTHFERGFRHVQLAKRCDYHQSANRFGDLV